jgi:transcriptional regulator with XRE-family HTH domain
MKLLKSEDLAKIAREERIRKGLTQDQVADMVALREDTKSCTKQAISQAENPQSGSKLDSLRIKIIEELTKRKVVGPRWYFEGEVHQDSG